MQRGIALLFTLLIIGVAISLSVGVFNIIIGELEIGEGARESTRAFFAADSGVECVLYWDLKEQAFVFGSGNEGAITCAGASFQLTRSCATPFCEQVDGKNATVYQNSAALTLGNGACASLTVIKFEDGASRIAALGENTCDPAATRIVQRGIEVNY
jgi:hypothetical protein